MAYAKKKWIKPVFKKYEGIYEKAYYDIIVKVNGKTKVVRKCYPNGGFFNAADGTVYDGKDVIKFKLSRARSIKESKRWPL